MGTKPTSPASAASSLHTEPFLQPPGVTLCVKGIPRHFLPLSLLASCGLLFSLDPVMLLLMS